MHELSTSLFSVNRTFSRHFLLTEYDITMRYDITATTSPLYFIFRPNHSLSTNHIRIAPLFTPPHQAQLDNFSMRPNQVLSTVRWLGRTIDDIAGSRDAAKDGDWTAWHGVMQCRSILFLWAQWLGMCDVSFLMLYDL